MRRVILCPLRWMGPRLARAIAAAERQFVKSAEMDGVRAPADVKCCPTGLASGHRGVLHPAVNVDRSISRQQDRLVEFRVHLDRPIPGRRESLSGWRRAERGPRAGAARKSVLAVQLMGRGCFQMKTVADTLGVGRPNLAEAARGQRRPRQPYRKAGDAELVTDLRRLVDARPTYGYPGSRPCSITSVAQAASPRSTASACSGFVKLDGCAHLLSCPRRPIRQQASQPPAKRQRLRCETGDGWQR